MENTHSIIRAQTKPSDTAKKLQQRAKTIFQSKSKQRNFRSTFTPPKQFSFSQQQLKYLKVKSDECLTNIFITISNNIGSAWMSTIRKKKYVHLPHIFGQAAMKCTVLPLGFNTCEEPNQDCVCDLKSCKVNTDEPWKLFQGCWHSFHEQCLNGSPFCPICQVFLKAQTEEMGNIAKNAIFNLQPDIPTQSVIQESEEETSTETVPSDLHALDVTVEGLKKKISKLTPLLKPLHQHRHKLPVISPTSTTIAKTSSSTEPQRHPLQEVQNFVQQQKDQDKSISGTTEWLLPSNICQTKINGKPMASNACTIIASLWCRKFLLNKVSLPLVEGGIDEFVDSYKQTIFTGNELYGQLHLPCYQPNLEVQDVVNRIKDLKLKILLDIGFFTVHDLRAEPMKMLQIKPNKKAGVLIIPPATSVVVLMDKDQIAIFDSHQHGVKGGLVLLCDAKNIDSILNYLGKTQTLRGCNFARLGLA